MGNKFYETLYFYQETNGCSDHINLILDFSAKLLMWIGWMF